jgi:hypothetical protein
VSAAGLSPAELIALALDGRPEPDAVERLVRLAALDPAIRRQLIQHLVISEVASQVTAPERSADAFIAGLAQRRRAEADGLAFTARVLAAARAERRRRLVTVGAFVAEVAGMGVAAMLMVSLLAVGVHALNREPPHRQTRLDDDLRFTGTPTALSFRAEAMR